MASMGVTRLLEAPDDIFDQALMFHGFTKYMWDFELIAYCHTWNGRPNLPPIRSLSILESRHR